MRVQCSQEQLMREVQIVTRAISSRASMPILSNLLLDSTGEILRITATDLELGIESQVRASVLEPGSITVPARIFGDIIVNLPAAPITIDVSEGDTKTRITCESIKFEILGLPAADFPLMPSNGGGTVAPNDAGVPRRTIRQNSLAVSPDEKRPVLIGGCLGLDRHYGRLIPSEFKQRIKVGTERLLRAVRRASITARDSANVVRLSAAERTLTVSSNTPEVGKAQEEIDVQADGETIQVAFNAKFLLDALANMDSAEVLFELTGSLSPGMLRPVEHAEYVYVLAPVRVYRSEEHTSELQSRLHLVCRLLLEKKN